MNNSKSGPQFLFFSFLNAILSKTQNYQHFKISKFQKVVQNISFLSTNKFKNHTQIVVPFQIFNSRNLPSLQKLVHNFFFISFFSKGVHRLVNFWKTQTFVIWQKLKSSARLPYKWHRDTLSNRLDFLELSWTKRLAWCTVHRAIVEII